MERSLQHLKAIEKKAEEILVDKNEIIALEKRRNSNREGLNALRVQCSNNVWMEFGPTLIKLSKQKAEKLIVEDQNTIEFEVNKLRSSMKEKVGELQNLEYKPELSGFGLKPLSLKELNAVKQCWGERSS